MANFCKYCGRALNPRSRFCPGCGSPVEGASQAQAPQQGQTPASQPAQAPAAQYSQAPQQGQAAQQGWNNAVQTQRQAPSRHCGYMPPQYAAAAQQGQPYPGMQPPKKSSKKMMTSAICIGLAAVLAFTAFVKPGFLLSHKDGSGSSSTSTSSSSTGKNSGGLFGKKKDEPEVLKASAEELEVKSDTGVKVELSPFLFDYDEERELTVKKAGVEKTDDGNCQITSYDFDFGGEHELDTFVDIRIPYEGKFCDKGEDPAECVGAMYFNEETGEWEDVLYEVDADAKEVVIHTDHFSRFGCFEVKNAGYRKAKISSIDQDYLDFDVDLDQQKAALAEYAANGGPGEQCYKLGELPLSTIYNDVLLASANTGNDWVGNAGTALSLSDLFFFTEKYAKFNEGFWKNMGHVGFALGAINIVTQMVNSKGTDSETAALIKDIGLWGLGAAAEGGLSIALVGVTVLDKAIQSFGEAAKGYRVERINNIYVYYNDVYSKPGYHARTSKEWRDVVARCVKDSEGDDATFKSMLEEEIDTYSRAFFNGPIDTDSWEIQADFAEHFSGARVGVITKDEEEELVKNYKERMYQRLSGAILKELQKDYELKVKQNYLKSLNNIKDELNKSIQFNIHEIVEENEEPSLGEYQIRFSPLSGAASTKEAVQSWTGKLKKDGTASTQVSVIGYIIAGLPDTLDVYEPKADLDKDEPYLSAKFSFKYPTTDVPLDDTPFPTLEELEGLYENGTATVLEIGPPEIVNALKNGTYENPVTGEQESCDIDLESYIGQETEMVFDIERLSDTTARFVPHTDDSDQASGFSEMTFNYDEKTGILSGEPLTTEEGTMTLRFECTYTDKQKTGVQVDGLLHYQSTQKEGLGLYLNMSVKGSKPLE